MRQKSAKRFALNVAMQPATSLPMLQRNKMPLSTGYKVFQVSSKRTLYAAQVHFSHSSLVPNRFLFHSNSSLRLIGRILILCQSHGFFLSHGL
jgi:hypothetical protein